MSKKRERIFCNMKCPICGGNGGWQEDFGEGTILYEPCNQCKETGKVSVFYIIRLWIWQNFRL